MFCNECKAVARSESAGEVITKTSIALAAKGRAWCVNSLPALLRGGDLWLIQWSEQKNAKKSLAQRNKHTIFAFANGQMPCLRF